MAAIISCDINHAGMAALFERHGAVLLKGFFSGHHAYQRYVDDLCALTQAIYPSEAASPAKDATLAQRMDGLFALQQSAAVPIYHLATQPMKLMSGLQLKTDPQMLSVVTQLLGKDSLLGTTHASDNLLAIPPGEKFNPYVLPIHQDFPYQLQSEAQLVFWMPLTPYVPGVGTLNLWLGSHRHLYPSHKNVHDHYEAVIEAEALAAFEKIELQWELGDLLVLHGHVLHQALPNRTQDHLRLVQIFRYTDLRHASAQKMRYYSQTYPRPGTTLNEAYPGYDQTND